MILLDTNVVSELIRPNPDPKVEAWLAEQYFANVFLTVISEARTPIRSCDHAGRYTAGQTRQRN